MEASKQQLLQRRRTAVGTAGVIWPPQKVLTKLANVDQIVHKTPFRYKHTMWFGKNKGELYGRVNGTGHFEWKPTISKRRYDLLLKLKHPDPHPNIVTIDEGEWKYSIDDDDLPLECALRISNPIENRTTSIEGGLIDLHRMSVDDVINSEGKMLISDTYHMCKNILSALDFLSHQDLVMGEFSAEDIAYTATGYKIMNVDRSEIPDGSAQIVDLRSVGVVMVKMLTRTEISHAEPLMLPSDKLDALEDYIGCERFLEIAEDASKKKTDLRSYRKRLLLLKDMQLATWHWRNMPGEEQLEKEQLERSRRLSLEVGQEQPNII